MVTTIRIGSILEVWKRIQELVEKVTTIRIGREAMLYYGYTSKSKTVTTIRIGRLQKQPPHSTSTSLGNNDQNWKNVYQEYIVKPDILMVTTIRIGRSV